MKTKFLSRIGMWNTPPCIRKCLTSLKALTLLLVMGLSVNLMAAEATITFANQTSGTSDGSSAYTTSNFVSSGIASSDDAFGTITCSATEKCYSGKVGYGLKAGASSNAGSFTISFSSALKNVTKIVLHRASYSTSKTATITVKNGETTLADAVSTPLSSADFSDMEIKDLNIASLSALTVKTSKYCYIRSITITYSADDPDEPSLSVSPKTIDFGTVYQKADVAAQQVTVTFSNLTVDDVEANTNNLTTFDIDKYGPFTSGDKITITPNTYGLGKYEETLILFSETDGLEEMVTITMEVIPAPVLETYNKVTAISDLAEGDIIVLASSTTAYGIDPGENHAYIDAMKFTDSQSASLTGNVLKAADAYELTLAKSGDNWTMTGANGLVGTSAPKALKFGDNTATNTWSISIDGNANASIESTTSAYGKIYYNSGSPRFLNYTSSQTAIQIYKKELPKVYSAITLAPCENGEVSVIGAADLTSVASGTEITLGNTPADGYKLDAYDVYKTGESSTKVTVKEENGVYTFKMPAYAVTVSATFSLSIETPVLSEEAGDKDDAINVKVTNYNGDYSYYYTLDGTDPTNASTAYNNEEGIAINVSCTLKVIAYDDAVTSPVVSAAYNLPLMTMDAIFAAATAAGKTATDARVKFTDCVVTGVKNANAYLTDNAGKGLIIYQSNHGFEVNDKLNGAVNVKVQLYNGSAELTALTSSTSGLTVTKDGSVSPITTIGIASLSGVNTGAVLSYENLVFDGDKSFSDGTNTIQPYNNFSIENYPTFKNGDKYNVTGVYLQYNSIKEIMPRSLDDLEKIEAQKYAINLATVEHGTIATDPETEAADGVKVTLSATPETGYMLSAWSVVDAESNPVEVIANQFTMPAKAVTVSATFVELPIWATTYTSNVKELLIGKGNSKVKFSAEGTEYEAVKAGSSNDVGSTTITVPAGTYTIHFHAAGWNSENVTLAVKKGETVLGSFDIPKDAGMNNNSPFTLANDPAAEEYFMVALSDVTEETTITFTATSGKRFAIYGVNAVQPAAITINPTSKDFGEVKQGFDAEQVFTLTPNALATGTITAEIDGDEVFAAGTVSENKVTVTFAPTEITDYNATLIIKHDGTQMCSATLTGKGITATTPEIAISTDEIDFGKVKQDATIADKTVTVTLNYLDAATASIDDDTYFSIDKTDLVAGANTITISVTASSQGEKRATITIEGTGATTKTIAVKMDVASKWAGDYNTDACITMSSSQNAKVIIDGKEYPAVKANDAANATITLPEGVTNLYFHAAAWNGESVTLTAYKGTTIEDANKLGEFTLVSDGGVKSNSPYTLAGENYDTDQYFHIDGLTNITEGQVITFVPNDNRYVIYGVHQEGGIVDVLQSIEIQGTASALNYEVGQTFVPTGLKVVGTFKKGEEEPTSRDLKNTEFDWSFNPASFTSTEQNSVNVTATAKENTEITASKTIENIVVIAPVVEISTISTKVDFGTVAQGKENIEPELVYVIFKNCTEASVALSGDDAAKFKIDANKVEAGDYNWVTVGVADGTTATAGEYAAILTIHAEGAIADIVLPVTLFVEAPDNCDGTDDFETSENKNASDYKERSTTAGWSAVNAARTTISDDVFFTINGKTSAVGTITSPELTGGIASLKIRYANTFQETNGVSFRVDIKQGEDVVKTYTITKANADVAQNTVYTETISDINVAGTFQIVITNLSPTNSTSNKDRLSIGRLCWTAHAPEPQYETIRDGLTIDNYGTICYPRGIEAGNYKGAIFFSISYKDVENSLLIADEVTTSLEAGRPYIFLATDTKIQAILNDDEVDEPNNMNTNGLYGVFEKFDITEENTGDIYLLSSNVIRNAAAGSWLAANRAYIKLGEVSTAVVEQAPGRRRMVASTPKTTPTSMEEIFNAASQDGKFIINGQLFIFSDGKVFNAQGALVK